MEVKGILWHSTGANNPNIKRYVQPFETDENYDEMIEILGKNTYGNDWNHIEKQVGMNAWIGKLANGTVTTVQTMPWDYRPWGCGSGKNGSCNNGWIQFEICEDSLTDGIYFSAAYNEACELTAYLCQLFDIDPEGTVEMNGIQVPTILCHYDSWKLGLGSNHGDIDHWFPKFGRSMRTVRSKVKKLLNPEPNTSNPTIQPPTSLGDIETPIITPPLSNADKAEEKLEQQQQQQIIIPPLSNADKAEMGLTNNTTPLTQAQFNKMMDNYLTQLALKQPSEWSAQARAWSEPNGIITGDEYGNRMYKKFITREELITILFRLYGNK